MAEFENKKEFDFPYLSLRLPDVIGPYDDTFRYWSYLKWIQENKKNELEIVTITENLYKILFYEV